MKTKYALMASLVIILWGCDDSTAGLGLGMFPGSDQNINGKLSTFDVTAESIHAGKIYAVTDVGCVEKFTDETLGTYQAGFLAEFNCPAGMAFPRVYDGTALGGKKKATRVMVNKEGLGGDMKPIYNTDNEDDPNRRPIDNIHTIELCPRYGSYFGNSLTACRLSVYELGEAEEELNQENAYYTDVKPEEFYSSKNLLGTKAYAVVDLSVKGSVRKPSMYVPGVHASFKQNAAIEVGTKIIQKVNELGINFDDKTFREIFKGIYVKSDYGDDAILCISQVQMNVIYKCYAVDTLTGVKLRKKVSEEGDIEYKDSTYCGCRTFATTREAIRANQLQNDKVAVQNYINNPEQTHLKSPAGISTQLTLPVSQIAKKLQGDTLNAVRLGIPIYDETSSKKFGVSTPKNVLLIRKRYRDSFSKDNQLSDGITSSLFSPTTSFIQYTFNNITQITSDCSIDGEREEAEKKPKSGGMITLQITNSEDKADTRVVYGIEEQEKYSDWNESILIPILITTDASSSNSCYGSSSNVINIQHDLKPGYTRLKGGISSANTSLPEEGQGKRKLELEVVFTNLGIKSKQEIVEIL